MERGTGGEVLKTFVLLLALLVAAPAFAQPGRAPFIPPKDDGFELFRGLLHFHGVKPVSRAELRDFGAADYADLIVVVLDCSAVGESDWAGRHTKLALKNGGAVLVASDQACDLSFFLPDVAEKQAVILGGIVQPPPAEPCYGGDRNLPILQANEKPADGDPALALFAAGADHPNGPLRIAANRPSAVRVTRRAESLRLGLAFCTQERREPPPHEVMSVVAGGAGGRPNPFRALVIADQDILSNAMLYASGQPDRAGFQPDNWLFAHRLVKDFLREPTNRARCLFVENGRVIDKFDDVELKAIQSLPSVPPIPLPNPLDRKVQRKLAELIDGGLTKLEDNTAADKLLAGRPDEPGQPRYRMTMTVLGAAAAVVLVGFMVRRLYAARHRKRFVPAPSDPLFLGDHAALGSFGQRRAELLRGDDFGDAVAHRVRALFAARGLPPDFAARRLPRIEFRSSRSSRDGALTRSDRDRLEADIRRLWAVAGDDGVPLPYSEWKDWEPILAQVHAAAVADRWRFAATPEGPA